MTFLRVMAFSLVVLLTYTLFANILPQVQSDPPKEEKVDVGALDAAGLAAWGERLFKGKGTCTLCHNELGRAPDLLNLDLATEFAERIEDPRYNGAAKGLEGAAAIEAYVRESMLDPSAYVVAGYGKKGTNDTVSPMPAVDRPPIGLGEAEIDALIAFLEDRAGVEVTVKAPSGEAAQAAAASETGGEEEGPAQTAQEVIDRLGCAGCHDLEGSGADVGPPLAGIGQRYDRATIRQSILDPNAKIADGFEPDIMPQDYAEQLRVSELELLLDYLQNLPAKEAAQ